MTNKQVPLNAKSITDDEENPIDDSGRRVVVNSIGGPSWPDDVWKRALDNVGGTVVY